MLFRILKNIEKFEIQKVIKQTFIPCFFAMLLFGTFSSLPIVSGDVSCFTSLTQTTTGNYKGGVFVDSYWTDRSASSDQTINPMELEVAPGDGPSTLAVVLTNTSDEELIGVKGYLKLPEGYKPYGLSVDPKSAAFFDQSKGAKTFTNTASASYPALVSAGQTITLYFDIDVTNSTKVGATAGQLIAEYSTTRLKDNCFSSLMNIPFILPGKAILDVVSQNQYLYPETANPVTISISNDGTADATGVVATIVGLGDQGSRSSGSGSSVTLQSSDTKLVNLGPNTFNIGIIPAGKTIDVHTILFPDSTAAGTVQNLDLQINYGNSYGYKQTITQTTGLVVSPQPASSSLIVTSSSEVSPPLITAGKVDDYKFEVKNNSDIPMTDLLLTLSSGSDSVKIVGNSKWTIDELPAGSTQELTAQIFSSTSIINTPISFTLTSEYITNGESKTDSSTLGAYVSGNINLVFYDVSVNQIGNSLYVVGNVLNQGSTTGKFASIELVSYPTQTPPNTDATSSNDAMAQNNPGISGKSNQNQKIAPQYIGDLNEESSIPFSIPLPMRSLSPGTYPFTFKIVYADDLKNFHEIEFNQQVTVSPIQQSGGPNQRQGGGSSNDLSTFVILGLVGGSAATAIVLVKKRKFSKLKFKTHSNFNDDDIEKLLDSSTNSKQNKSAEK
jgi:hypothetical protein